MNLQPVNQARASGAAGGSRTKHGGPRTAAAAPEALADGAWFAVETLPQKEAVAVQNINLQGLETFWPRFWKTRRHARRMDNVLAPLFPGYVFTRMNPNLFRWRSLNGTFGVRRLVMGASGKPEPVPAPVMDYLQARCTDGVMGDLLGDLQPGQTAKVLAGPFASHIVTIERADSRTRVRVLLEIMGTARLLELDRASLGPG